MYRWIYQLLKNNGFIKKNKDLSLLDPLGEPSVLEERYYIGLMRQLSLGIGIFIFIILIGAIQLMRQPMYKDMIERNPFGKGARFYELVGIWEDHKEEKVQIEVGEKLLTKEEFEQLVTSLKEELPILIKGENPSLLEIRKPLYLPQTFLHPNLRLSYEYDNRYIGYQGELSADVEKEKELILKVICEYEDMKSSFDLTLRLLPRGHKDELSLERRLQELILSDPYQENIELPKMINGKKIVFKNRDWTFLYQLVLAMCILSFLFLIVKKQRLEHRIVKRKEEIEKDYSEVVIGLMLFMGAGYTPSNALKMVVQDYREHKNKKKRYLYEELDRACRQLDSGLSEKIVYQSLGERSQSNWVLKLTEILSGYITKGNHGVLQLMEEEAKAAMEQRKLLARKEGEEASIKLLGPMMGMLLVVMMILLVPAFLQFRI